MLLRTFFYSPCNYFSLHFVSSSTSLRLWDFQQIGLSILDTLQGWMFTLKWLYLEEEILVHHLTQQMLSKQYSYKAVLHEDRSAGRIVLRISPVWLYLPNLDPGKIWRPWFSSVHRVVQECSHSLLLGWIRTSHLYLTSDRINRLIHIKQVLRCFSGLAAEYVNKG